MAEVRWENRRRLFFATMTHHIRDHIGSISPSLFQNPGKDGGEIVVMNGT